MDCSNGGTTVTLAGNGASYLILTQFPVDLVPDTFVNYRLSSGTAISASFAPPASRFSASRLNAAHFGLTPPPDAPPLRVPASCSGDSPARCTHARGGASRRENGR